jgi:perosamine synthetase
MTDSPVLSHKYLKATFHKTSLPDREDQRRYFFFWTRNAIFHGLRALGLSPGDVVLIPSYICSSAIQPILAYGAKTDFYEIHSDCQPSFSDLESKVRPQTKAVLAVHYFGFPCDIRRFRELCDQHHLYLIEDCAHALRGEVDGRRIGTFGDISVFGWRKFLPLYDGGELVLNSSPRDFTVDWCKESRLFTLKVAKNLLDRSIASGRHPLLRALADLAGRSRGGWDWLLRRAKRRSPALSVNSNSASFDKGIVNLPTSRLSRWLLGRSDIDAILAKRRSNYLYLRRALSSVSGLIILFADSTSDVFPWAFPVVFQGVEDAHLALRRRGIPAVRWEVTQPPISRESFPGAAFLSENLVLLPLHQSLSEKDLRTIVEAVKLVQRAPAERQTQA